MNKVILIGNLTRDPEVKYTTGESPLAIGRFSIAVARPYSKSKERETDFINCVAFGKTAENIGKYFVKGNKIGISGRIQTNRYQDKDGNDRTATDVVVEDFEFCVNSGGSSGSNSAPTPPAPAKTVPAPAEDVDDEDLPF